MEKQPKFKVREEVICKIDGQPAYIILPFKAAVVKLGRALRVIPEENLLIEEPLKKGVFAKPSFVKGDLVRIIPTEKKVVTGEVVDSKWFYVIHFHRTGELKIAFAEVLVKAGTKIIPFSPLTQVKPILIKYLDKQNFERRIIKGGKGG